MTTSKAGAIKAEPTVGVPLQIAVRLLSARRVLNTPRVRSRLSLTGLSWDEMVPILNRIRGVSDWVREWERAAKQSAAQNDWAQASAQAFLAQIIVSPHAPQKADLLSFFRACYVKSRQEWGKANLVSFSKHALMGGKLSAYYEKPLWGGANKAAQKPTVLLLPPLASGKEELTPLADPLLQAGYSVLRIDMPAQGESPGPLFVQAETLLSAALDELGLSHVIAGGISLGAFWALRLAAREPRVAGVMAVSPPGIVTRKDWTGQPPIIWQYLSLYFGTPTRRETLAHAVGLTLVDVAENIPCPLLLFHAARDKIARPSAPARYRAAFAHRVPFREIILPDRHGCALHLRSVIAPEFVRWCDNLSGQEAASFVPNDKPTTIKGV